MWKYQVTRAQKARDKQWNEDLKREKDPLLSSSSDKMPGINVKFPGGFSIGFRDLHGKKEEKPTVSNLVRAKDVSDLQT